MCSPRKAARKGIATWALDRWKGDLAIGVGPSSGWGHVLEEIAGLELGVGDGGRDVEDWSGWDPGFLQNFQRGVVIVEALQPVLDMFAHLGSALAAFDLGGVARVGCQLRLAHGLDQRRPLVLGNGKDDIAVCGLVDAVGTDVEKVAAKPVGPNGALTHLKEREVDVVEIDQGFELRDVDVLAFPAHGAVEQGRANPQGAVNPGVGVPEVIADIGRRAIGIARHGHHPALRLGNDIEAGVPGIRTVLTVARDRTHDQTRVQGFERVVVQAVFGHHPGAVVFHHHVHPADQLAHNFERLGLLEIDTQTFFCPRRRPGTARSDRARPGESCVPGRRRAHVRF